LLPCFGIRLSSNSVQIYDSLHEAALAHHNQEQRGSRSQQGTGYAYVGELCRARHPLGLPGGLRPSTAGCGTHASTTAYSITHTPSSIHSNPACHRHESHTIAFGRANRRAHTHADVSA